MVYDRKRRTQIQIVSTEGDEKNTIKCTQTQNKKETCLADVKARWWVVQRVALRADCT